LGEYTSPSDWANNDDSDEDWSDEDWSDDDWSDEDWSEQDYCDAHFVAYWLGEKADYSTDPENYGGNSYDNYEDAKAMFDYYNQYEDYWTLWLIDSDLNVLEESSGSLSE